MTNTRILWAYAAVFAGLAVLCGIALASPVQLDWATKEYGIVELASAAGYGVCIALLIWHAGFSRIHEHHRILILAMVCMFRELDFDKKFTTMGIFKSRFYSSDTVPMFEKVIGAVVILVLLYLLLTLIYRNWRRTWQDVRKFEAVAVGTVLLGGLFVVAKTLDGLARKLSKWGIEVSERLNLAASSVEEILELGIPIILGIAIIAWFRLHVARPPAP